MAIRRASQGSSGPTATISTLTTANRSITRRPWRTLQGVSPRPKTPPNAAQAVAAPPAGGPAPGPRHAPQGSMSLSTSSRAPPPSPSRSLAVPAKVQAALHVIDENHRNHIEYGSPHIFLSNHVTHAAIALAELGASAERIRGWCAPYLAKIKPPTLAQFAAKHGAAVVFKSPVEVLGVREAYPQLVRFFEKQLVDSSIVQVVQAYISPTLNGFQGAALHPIIHLGFALFANSPKMVAEGMAYMYSGYHRILPDALPRTSLAQQQAAVAPLPPLRSPVEFLNQAVQRAKTMNAPEQIARALDEPPLSTIHQGTFQARMYAFSYGSLPYWPILADRIDWKLQRGPAEQQKAAVAAEIPSPQEEELLAFLAKFIAGGVMTSQNEFFFVHGLTSFWSLLELYPLLESAGDRERALTHWFRTIVAVFVVQNFPGEAELGEWVAELEQEATSDHEWLACEGHVTPSGTPTSRSDRTASSSDQQLQSNRRWTEAFSQATKGMESARHEDDEHSIKAVMCLHHLWERFGGTAVFLIAAEYVARTPLRIIDPSVVLGASADV